MNVVSSVTKDVAKWFQSIVYKELLWNTLGWFEILRSAVFDRYPIGASIEWALLKTIHSKGDSAQLKNSMLKLINDRQVMHRSELELLEKIFNFQFESKELIHAVKEQLLLGNFQWSAKLKITIVEAIGLLPKDNNGSSDPYCLVQGKNHIEVILGSITPKTGNRFG